MLKRSLLSLAAVLAATTSFAADLPSRRAPVVYAPPAPFPVFTWTGAYIGGNVGYAFTDRDQVTTSGNDAVANANLALGTVPARYRLHSDGITAGGQIGYNFQIPTGRLPLIDGSGFVFGVEADAAYTDLRRNDTAVEAFQVTSVYHQRLDYLGTVRGRLGIALDRFLVYGTGGFAYGESSFSHAINAGNFNNSLIWGGGRSGMQTGYAVGGGIEYALPTGFLSLGQAGAVTVRAEYLHYDLGSRTVLLEGGLGKPFSFTDRYATSGNLVRAALNYKFSTYTPAPVVARY